jgi:hypothetical protein
MSSADMNPPVVEARGQAAVLEYLFIHAEKCINKSRNVCQHVLKGADNGKELRFSEKTLDSRAFLAKICMIEYLFT